MAGAAFPSLVCRSGLRLRVLVAVALACGGANAFAEGPKLKSREYRLMLDPGQVAGDAQARIDRFWNEALRRVIEERLDRKNNGDFRHEGRFKPDDDRVVVFRDTETCLLNGVGYSLRERKDLADGTRELTIKFRSPDL